MIEANNTNELRGQMDLGDLLGTEAAQPPEGYDAEGHLLDYVPENPTTADAVPLPFQGRQGADAQEAASADAQGIPYEKPGEQGTGNSEDTAAPVIPSAVEGSSLTDRLTALAVEINAITEQTRGVVISAALAVGKRLIEARSLCPAGRWTEWLEKSVNYSERKAQDMMRLYTEYGRDGQIPDSIAALDYSKAVALLSAPAEAREGLAVRANDEDLSVRQLQNEIKKLKEETSQQRMVIDGLRRENDSVRDDGQALQDDNDKLEAELKQTRAAVASAAEKIANANAKADAAESAAAELRKLHSDAEDRAAANAQRASDAVNRANQTAKELAEARAEIAKLREQGTANREQGTGNREQEAEVRTVEVIPESVTRELEQLRAQLAEAQAALQKPSPSGEGGPRSGPGEVVSTSATERFKIFYANQMKPAFVTALTLLREVAQEDGHAADAFATALTKGCEQLMGQLGTK